MNKTFNISSTESLGPIASDLKLIGFSKQDAFVCLYDAYVDLVHRYVNFRVADDEVTENITSQVFLKAWEQLPAYQTEKSPIIAWLYSIANHAISDHDHSGETSIAFSGLDPAEINRENGVDEKLDLQSKLRQLDKALEELADKQQQVLILKFICGFSTLEITQQVEKQNNTISALPVSGTQGFADAFAIQKEAIYEQ